MLEALVFDLTIKHEIKHIFVNKPIFEKYTEVDEVYRKLVNLSIQSQDRWDIFLYQVKTGGITYVKLSSNFHHRLTTSRATLFGDQSINKFLKDSANT